MERPRWTLAQRLALVLLPPLAAAIIAAVGATLRWQDLPEEGARAEEPGVGDIFCFWHQCTFLAGWRFRRYGANVLISNSFDGELVARTLALLGYKPVRGSSGRRGAVTGLLALRDIVARGEPAVFTADGPRGPAFQAKAGPAKLAQLTGAPLGSFHLQPARAWALRSWDRFLIPLPFSRVAVAWSRKLPAPAPEAGEEELEACRAALDAALERARHRALAAVGRSLH